MHLYRWFINLSKRKQISLILTLVLLAGVFGYLYQHRIFADILNPYIVSGRVFESKTKTPLQGVILTFSSTYDNEKYPSKEVTTKTDGSYSVSFPVQNAYDHVRVEKEGYIDLEGSAQFVFIPQRAYRLSLILVMDPGFGAQTVHLQTINPGKNLISTPIVPINPDPTKFFTYYTVTNVNDQTSYGQWYLPVMGTLTSYSNDKHCISSYLQSSGRAGESGCPAFDKIEVGNGYWLENQRTVPYVVVVKGALPQDGDVTIPRAGNALLGYKNTSSQPLTDVGVSLGGETYTLKQAKEQGLIEGLLWWDNPTQKLIDWNPQTNPNALAQPGRGYQLRLENDNTKFSFGDSGPDSSFVEVPLPEGVSLEDVTWFSAQNDPFILSQSDQGKWSDIWKQLIYQSQEYMQNNPISGTEDVIVNFTYNNKPVPVANVSDMSSQAKLVGLFGINYDSNMCTKIDKIKICAIPGQTIGYGHNKYITKDWPNQPYSTDMLFNLFEIFYPEIKNYLDPPSVETTYFIGINVSDAAPLAVTDPVAKTILLSPKDFDGSWESHKEKSAILHEWIHMFEGDALSHLKYLPGWAEGQTQLIEGLIDKKIYGDIQNQRVINLQMVIEHYSEFNTKRAAVKTSALWRSKATYGEPTRYYASAAAWYQVWSEDPAFFRKFYNLLGSMRSGYFNIDKADVALERVKPTVGGVKSSIWRTKQYSLYGVNNPYQGVRAVTFTARDASQYFYLWNIQPPDGKTYSFIGNKDGRKPDSYDIYPYHSYTAPDGQKKTELMKDDIYKGWNAAEYPLICPQGERCIFKNVYKDNGKWKPAYSYITQPYDDSSIYGTVSDAYSSTIQITPLYPNVLDTKDFPIRNGAFYVPKSAGLDYGWNAGRYYYKYVSPCGVVRDEEITKGEGKYFIAIRTGKVAQPTASIESWLEKIGFKNKALAQSCDSCCPPSQLEIMNINKEIISDTVVKVSYELSRSGDSMVEWGETNLYGNQTDMSSESKFDHEIQFDPVQEKQYHFNIFAMDENGAAPDDLEILTGDQTSVVKSAESGDQTFTVFKITDINIDSKSTSAVVTWSTTIETRGLVEYGTDINYGQTKSEPEGTNSKTHSLTIEGLIPNTTYHFRIKAIGP